MLLKDKEYKEDLPYERFVKCGSKSLTDAELLAILLRTGTRELNVLDLSKKILQENNKNKGLARLMELNYNELLKIKGIGKVKATQLVCIVELAKRLWKSSKGEVSYFDSPMAVSNYYMQEMRNLKREELHLALLDTRQRLLADILISRGTVNSSVISVRDLLIEALKQDAVNVILVHNHPSGDPHPSKEDIIVTKNVDKACILVGIHLNDHIIIGDNKYYSFKEQGVL